MPDFVVAVLIGHSRRNPPSSEIALERRAKFLERQRDTLQRLAPVIAHVSRYGLRASAQSPAAIGLPRPV